MRDEPPSPLERVERLYLDLVAHYEGGERRETRAATKLLLVALARLREHEGDAWERLVDEYVEIARERPEELARILDGNRGRRSM